MGAAFSSDLLSIGRDNAVATLWLDRPAARNAMGPGFFTDLPRAMAELAADDEVRVVVIAANGPDFSAGLDLKAMGPLLAGDANASPASRAAATRREVRRLQDAVSSVARCPKPVIAAVHGHCLGGGVDLVCACDIRLASADAVFSVRETKLAIVADLGSLQRLPRIVGAGHVAEIAFTGKDVDAARAEAIGLVNAVHPDRDALLSATRALAADIAALSPLAVQGTKAVLAANDGRSVEGGLEYVAAWNAGMLASEDLAEAMSAYVERRDPRFTGR